MPFPGRVCFGVCGKLFMLLVCLVLICGLPLNCTRSACEMKVSASFKTVEIASRQGMNRFAWKFFRSMAGANLPDNGVVSTQSIYQCLGMSYIASGGDTRTQLAAVLEYPKDNASLLADMKKLNESMGLEKSPGGSAVYMANGMWMDSTYASFRKDYVRQVEENFFAKPRCVKFASKQRAADEVNRWVAKKTRSRITKIIDASAFDSRTRPGVYNEPGLVLVNAIYFYSAWTSGFEKSETKERPFQLGDGKARDVKMMHQFGCLGYGKGDDYAVLRLGYKGVPYSMYIVLPDEVMAAGELVKWAGELKEYRDGGLVNIGGCNVDVLLPRFSISSDYDVKGCLERMGVADAFKSHKANFAKMITPRYEAFAVYISKICQQARIDVNEEGTEAAAATSSVSFTIGCSAPAPNLKVDFHADRPFVFMIVHDQTRAILFNGWVSNPR